MKARSTSARRRGLSHQRQYAALAARTSTIAATQGCAAMNETASSTKNVGIARRHTHSLDLRFLRRRAMLPMIARHYVGDQRPKTAPSPGSVNWPSQMWP